MYDKHLGGRFNERPQSNTTASRRAERERDGMLDFKSVRTRLTLLMTLVVLTVFVSMLVLGARVASLTREARAHERETYIQREFRQVTLSLDALSDFLYSYSQSAVRQGALITGNAEIDHHLSYQVLQQELSRTVILQPSIGCFLLYFKDDDYMLTVGGKAYSRQLASGRYDLWEWFGRNEPRAGQWYMLGDMIGPYLCYSLKQDTHIVTLAVSAEKLLERMRSLCPRVEVIDRASGAALVLGEGGETQPVTLDLPGLAFRVFPAPPEGAALAGMGVYLLLAALALLAIALACVLISRMILGPVSILHRAFMAVRAGDMDYRIGDENVSSEFAYLNHAFNSMVSDLQITQMTASQSKVRLLREEIRNLQKQIRSHFVRNCLNTVYALSYRGENDKVQLLASYLCAYLQYVDGLGADMETLGGELRALDNYLSIQRLIYPDARINWRIVCGESLKTCRIPAMILLSVAENAMKYGFCVGKPFSMSLSAVRRDGALILTFSDSGPGYSRESVERFEAGEEGGHVGLQNIQKRLRLIYGPGGGMRLYNAPEGGAVAEMTLPERNEVNHGNPVGG